MIFFRRRSNQATPALTESCVPDGRRVYAIGDIHGRHDLLVAMRQLIAEDLRSKPIANATTIFLGDYVDRGPDSRNVLEELITGQFPTATTMLKGNHELMLVSFLEALDSAEGWARNGGIETLHSYGVDVREFRRGKDAERVRQDFRARFPQTHADFMQRLILSCSVGDYFFCHAGVRPGIPLEAQSEADLLWIREEFLLEEYDFGKVVVHGHSPVLRPELTRNRINIDTGAYISNRLSCLVLEGVQRRLLSTGGA